MGTVTVSSSSLVFLIVNMFVSPDTDD